jgi:hypothetical protein
VDTWFAKKASPALTGTPTAPTAAPGTNTTQIATTEFATQLAFQAALPVQSTPSMLYSSGVTSSWRTTFIGDSGSGGELGPVPAPAAGDAPKFLKGEGTWHLAPSAPDVIIQDQKSSGVSGSAHNFNAWVTRDLNTVVRNQGSIAALAANTVSLGAGVYLIRARAATAGGASAANGQVRARLYNVSDSVVISQGEPVSVDGGLGGGIKNGVAEVMAVVTLASSKEIVLQTYMINLNVGTGGLAMSTGDVEVYATLEITKLQ